MFFLSNLYAYYAYCNTRVVVEVVVVLSSKMNRVGEFRNYRHED